MNPKRLVGYAAALIGLLWLANTCENASLRRQTKLVTQDSILHAGSLAIDSAVAVHRGADSVRFQSQLDSLGRIGRRVRVVTVARVDTLREQLPDSLRPKLDSIVAGFIAQLSIANDSAALIRGRLTKTEALLTQSQASAHAWEAQSGRWRKEATRWRLKLGPFTVRPCAGYGLTASGASVFVGGCLTP